MTTATPVSQLLGQLLKEAKRRSLTLTSMFTVIALVALPIGMMLPKRYDVTTVIVADNSNIIKPLMEGRAVATGTSDQTAVTTQTLMSKKIMREMLLFGGWVDPLPAPQPDAREEERMLNRLKGRIKIEPQREEFIRISYYDNDPKRAYKLVNKLAEVYVRESSAGKERESREAFDFIDKQVQEYGKKLTDAHEKVLQYYRGQDTPPPPAPDAPAPPPRPKVSAEELSALKAEEVALTAQLGRKPTQRVESRQAEDQLRSRVLQLQADLDRLLANYTEVHPDVKRVRRELLTVKDELHRAEQGRIDHERAADSASALDDEVARAARGRLEKVQARIQALTGRRSSSSSSSLRHAIAEAKADPEMRGVGTDTTMSELLRRYEATRDIYQDLLKRRENARVSMELDASHRGMTMRIQEPAEMPVTASGLRLLHLTMMGLIVAVLIPFGLLFAIVRLDTRVRGAEQIERLARVPLLVSIGYAPSHKENNRRRIRTVVTLLMVAAVFAVYATVFLIKTAS